jgi:hypothetical protein
MPGFNFKNKIPRNYIGIKIIYILNNEKWCDIYISQSAIVFATYFTSTLSIDSKVSIIQKALLK